jgi:hypothetical protein
MYPRTREGGIRASLSPLRRNRDFRRAYLSSLISLGDDRFLLVALFGLVLDLRLRIPGSSWHVDSLPEAS